MKILIPALLFAILALSAFSQSASAQNWRKYTPPAGHLSLSFPSSAEPTAQVTTTPDAKIGPYTTYLYSVVVDGTIYMVGWVDYSSTFRFDVAKEIAQNRDNFANGIKGKVVSERPIKFGSYSGIEFVVDTDNGTATAKARVIIVGTRPIMLIVVNGKGRDTAADAERFFSSFLLKGQPNTAWNAPR